MTSQKADFYRIQVGGEWGDFCINEATGSFFAHTTFGDYNFCWPYRGTQTTKQFLADLSFDYFMGKTRPDYQRFSASKTLARMKQHVCAVRRSGSCTKDEARLAFNILTDFEIEDFPDSLELVLHLIDETEYVTKVLGDDWHEFAQTEISEECLNFWSILWPHFLMTIRHDAPKKSLLFKFTGWLKTLNPFSVTAAGMAAR